MKIKRITGYLCAILISVMSINICLAATIGDNNTLSNSDSMSLFAAIDGSGTEDDPFLISSAREMELIHDMPDMCFKLVNDINLSSTWKAIGTIGEDFSGTFDGNGHTVSALNCTYQYTGIFSVNNGTIMNLKVAVTQNKKVLYSGSRVFIGAIAEENSGEIVNCSVSGNFYTDTETGRYTSRGPTKYYAYIGGIVGVNKNIIRNCGSRTNITSEQGYVGGITGHNDGEIENCYSLGNINANSSYSSYSGGLVGYNDGTVRYSYSVGKVTGDYNGGLIGYSRSYSDVVNSYYDKDVSGLTDTGKGEPKSTVGMQFKNIYINWDFINTWGLDDNKNNGYPYLLSIGSTDIPYPIVTSRPTSAPIPTRTPKPTAAPTPRPTEEPLDRFVMLRDNYSFANTYSSFGYSRDYRIPLERYLDVFGLTDGYTQYSQSGTWGGSCYGFSATSSLFFENVLDYKQYKSDAASLYRVPAPKIPKADLTVLLERYQIAQRLYSVSRERYSNYDDMSGIIQAVKNFENTGENPIILCMWSFYGGHAVVPYKCVTNSDGSYSIYVYDNNYPTSKNRIVKISKNMNSFSYDTYSRKISFNYADTVYSALEGKMSLMSEEDEVATVTINSKDISFTDTNGTSIDEIDGAYEVVPVEAEYDENKKEYVIPVGDYVIKNNNSELKQLQVSVSNDRNYQSVTTDDLNAEINVGIYGANGRVYAIVTSNKNSNHTIKTLNNKGVSKLLEAAGRSLGATASSDDEIEIVADSAVMCNGEEIQVGTSSELGSVNVSVENSAGNVPDGTVNAEIKENTLEYSNDTISGRFSLIINNNTEKIESSKIIIALYSENGSLISVMKYKNELLSKGENYINWNDVNISGISEKPAHAKCFIWDENNKPIISQIDFEIQ